MAAGGESPMLHPLVAASRHVVALCVDQRRGHPPRLALALKPSKRVTRWGSAGRGVGVRVA